jgi:phosphoesterase RecJ-like protein
MFNNKYKQIYKQIKKYDTIVIARHIGPDPDALGSQIGLREIILNAFPHKKVYAVGIPTSKFKFMGQLDKMPEDVSNALLIVVDTPDIKRIDGIDISRFPYKIKIDHHPIIDLYGDIEWVDDMESSVCQMIIELCFNTKLKMTKYAAERLFMGLVADTNRFLFYYTTIKTFDLIKRLMKLSNIDITVLYEQLYMRSLNETRLQGYIAQNINVTENGVAHIILKDDIIKEYKVDAASAGNLINNFNYIDGILVWVMISEDVKQNIIRINIRSRGPEVNEVAEKYNGGGHKYASGARVSSYEDAEKIVTELDALCKEYNKTSNKEI